MMEFTFNGIVRHGFGFYNPNHAAAFICALMPFVWAAGFRWRHWVIRVTTVAITVLLCIALAMTFSRTGLMVVIFQAVLFCLAHNRSRHALSKPPSETTAIVSLPSKRITWLICLLFIAVCAGAVTFSGGLSRFTLDRAVTNRFDIWKAGCALFASNPLHGVGLGNSGLVATSFLLRDGITCRTLINSHLTLLVEFGAGVGIVWLTMIFLSLHAWKRHPASFVSLIGLCFSAFSASIFDWEMLFDFHSYGALPLFNFILSWGMLLLFVFLLLRLCITSWSPKRVLGFVAASALLLCILAAFGGTAPKVSKNCIIVGHTGEKSAVIRGESFTMKDVAVFMKENGFESYVMPIAPMAYGCEEHISNCQRMILFGDAHELTDQLPDKPLIYVSPPEWAEISSKAEKVFLKRYADSLPFSFDSSKTPVEYY